MTATNGVAYYNCFLKLLKFDNRSWPLIHMSLTFRASFHKCLALYHKYLSSICLICFRYGPWNSVKKSPTFHMSFHNYMTIYHTYLYIYLPIYRYRYRYVHIYTYFLPRIDSTSLLSWCGLSLEECKLLSRWTNVVICFLYDSLLETWQNISNLPNIDWL